MSVIVVEETQESKSSGFVGVSTDNSVVSMDTDNDEYSGDLFLAKAALPDFDPAESCPEIYRCPISKELMRTPVMLHEDGHTYDEGALREWISAGNTRSPLTGAELKSTAFSRNYAVQSAIEQFEAVQRSMAKRSKLPLDDDSEAASLDLSDEEKETELAPATARRSADLLMFDPLKEFLAAMALEEYVGTFIDAGFVAMSDFENITFHDLVAMDIPIIHSRRMMGAIDEYNARNCALSQSQPLPDVLMTNSIIIRPGKVPKSQNSAPLNCNILLLGDANVGKTSLRKRLELDDFVATTATQGVELSCLLSNFQGEDLQITIWDPAGQERYAPITKTFFRRAHAAAIVFSADEPSTWNHVEFWIHELEQNAPDDIEAMLICNKIDLMDGKVDGDEELSELIKKAVALSAAKRMPFFTASAKSGEAVKRAFEELVSQTLSNGAILDKLYEQRDGSLAGRASSFHGPSPFDGGSPTKSGPPTKGRKLAKIRRKLSWRSGSKRSDKEFREFAGNDYSANIRLERGFGGGRRANGNHNGCCRG